MRGFGVAALALAGLAFAFAPLAGRIDLALHDARISFLHKFFPRPAPDDIIIVGVDDESVRRIPEPPGQWHQPLGRTLQKIAAAGPRAIGLDIALPGRSFDDVRPGLDQSLLAGLAAARKHSQFVVALDIDPRTRAARAIHAPFLAVLGEARLAIGIFARDADGVVRRFALAVPTEDGSFPTLAGRLCRALSQDCREGIIDFAFGAPFRHVPVHEVLAATDASYLEKLFRGRIVLVGETQRFANRFEVPVNLAGWEAGGPNTPGVVIHAAALRTALHGAPPTPAGKPVLLLMVPLAALLVLARDWRLAAVTALVAAALTLAIATAALRSGVAIDLAAALVTLLAAWVAVAVAAAFRRPP